MNSQLIYRLKQNRLLNMRMSITLDQITAPTSYNVLSVPTVLLPLVTGNPCHKPTDAVKIQFPVFSSKSGLQATRETHYVTS